MDVDQSANNNVWHEIRSRIIQSDCVITAQQPKEKDKARMRHKWREIERENKDPSQVHAMQLSFNVNNNNLYISNKWACMLIVDSVIFFNIAAKHTILFIMNTLLL